MCFLAGGGWAVSERENEVIRHPAGAVALSPVARRLGFYFAADPRGDSDTQKVVDFHRALLEHLRGRVVVVWDGGADHKGPAMREFLRKNRRLRLERLPAYSPHLDPVEAVRS